MGDLAAGLSVISLVANAEQFYQTGFAVSFWGAVTAPLGIFMALTGYCLYRWRETRCLSLGQFLELRYGSRFFRVFCAALRTIAELITNAIGPAIATNFFIYYLGLPHRITVMGINLPCYVIIVTLCLCLALVFIWPSGRISLLITDTFQGLLSYPIFVIIVGYIILNFSWTNDIAPVMLNRVSGQSFLNPYDVSELRDFNIFALVVTLFSSVLNRAGWIGNDTSGAGRTPYEQKMAGVLGAWKNGFASMMILLLAVVVITFMTGPRFMHSDNKFKISSTEIRQELSAKVLDDVVADTAVRAKVMKAIHKIPETFTKQEWDRPLSLQHNLDTPYFNAVRDTLGDTPDARHQFQKYRSLYQQMMMPSVVSKIFPVGMLGLFCLLMVMLLVSTDDSRIFNASSTLTQDVILPMFKGHLDQRKHLLLAAAAHQRCRCIAVPDGINLFRPVGLHQYVHNDHVRALARRRRTDHGVRALQPLRKSDRSVVLNHFGFGHFSVGTYLSAKLGKKHLPGAGAAGDGGDAGFFPTNCLRAVQSLNRMEHGSGQVSDQFI